MRDKIKDKNYFKDFIQNEYKILDGRINKLKEGLIANDRILSVKKGMTYEYLQIINAKYSLGITDFEDLKEDLCNGIQLLNESLVDNKGKIYIDKTNTYLDQYYVNYHQEILQYLALAYLLNISEVDFKVLINIIDRDNISDDLYEFIIKARFPNREQKRAEEYDLEKSVILKVYDKLRKSTKQSDKEEASKLVKQFLEKSFYHRNMNSYNSHNSKAAIYSGYWSYEAAVVVKIMDLKDNSFSNNKYYPKDLIN